MINMNIFSGNFMRNKLKTLNFGDLLLGKTKVNAHITKYLLLPEV